MVKLLNLLEAIIPCSHYYVGFSGGLDSTVLLHAMTTVYGTDKVTAVHVNHGVAQAADDWVLHAEQFCAQLRVPLINSWVTVDPQAANLEEELRSARYAVFAELMAAGIGLLLAHHAVDQAETILMRLFRGTGPVGLSGMQESSSFKDGILLRPFLGVEKELLEEYASTYQLRYIVDPSNEDCRFHRNFLRQEILPLLKTKWPRVVKSINRCGSLCYETVTALQVLVEQDWERVKTSTNKNINLQLLRELNLQRRLGVLRYWLQLQGLKMPSYEQILRIDREIVHAEHMDKVPRLDLDMHTIFRDGDCLLISEL